MVTRRQVLAGSAVTVPRTTATGERAYARTARLTEPRSRLAEGAVAGRYQRLRCGGGVDRLTGDLNAGQPGRNLIVKILIMRFASVCRRGLPLMVTDTAPYAPTQTKTAVNGRSRAPASSKANSSATLDAADPSVPTTTGPGREDRTDSLADEPCAPGRSTITGASAWSATSPLTDPSMSPASRRPCSGIKRSARWSTSARR
jgi:hypothetical protein